MKVSRPSPVESERALAVIPREFGELRVRRVRLVNGLDFLDVRFWKKTWWGHVPKKGVAIHLEEAPAVAAALEKGSK